MFSKILPLAIGGAASGLAAACADFEGLELREDFEDLELREDFAEDLGGAAEHGVEYRAWKASSSVANDMACTMVFFSWFKLTAGGPILL